MAARRGLLTLSAAGLVWATIVAMTGGFFLRLGPVIISSRRTTPALLLAILSFGAAVGLTIARGREAARADWLRSSERVAAISSAVQSLARQYARLIPLAILLFVVIQSAGRWTTVRPLWLDEESTLINVRDRSLSELSNTLWFGQSAPLGWLAIERAVMVTAGEGDRGLRLVPVLLGLGTCAIAYLIGRRWMNSVGAAAFVWCCAFGQWLVHSRFEAKPYSGDVFTSVLLIGLAAWAIDGETALDRRRRVVIWWTAAAAAMWLANGAMMTAPGCVLVLFGAIWRRDGLRAAVRMAAWGGVWIASFALCYWFSLRFTLGSTYLYDYWASISSFPQQGATILERLEWLGGRLKELGENPGGTTLWLVMWISALAGVVLSRRRVLAILAAAPPLTAFAVGLGHLVPLHDRVALWMMPGVYLAVGLLADRGAEWLRSGARRRAWLPIAASLLAIAPVVWLCNDIFGLRDHDAPAMGGVQLNHGLDDRRAIAYLMAHRRPGDAVLTTHLTWSTIWWYGHVSMADGAPATNGRFADGGVELEAYFDDGGGACRNEASLADRLRGERRVLVYLGFPDQSIWFPAALEAQLTTLGTVQDFEMFGDSVVMIVDPHVPATLAPPVADQRCIGANVATRW